MPQVVGLIFSKDRAMQLDATVRSLSMHCQDIDNIDIMTVNGENPNTSDFGAIQMSVMAVASAVVALKRRK